MKKDIRDKFPLNTFREIVQDQIIECVRHELSEILKRLEKQSNLYVPFQKIHYQSALKDIKKMIDENIPY